MALALLIGTGILLFSFTSMAQMPGESLEEEIEPGLDVAPVTVDGEDLFTVVGVSAHPAEERATKITLRIVEAAEKGRGTPNFRVQQTEFGPAIYIHGIYITTVTQVDVDFEGLDAPTLAKMIGEKVRDEILAYRERRSDSGRTESIITAMGWTVIFVAFSVMLWFGSRYLIGRADHKIVSWVQRVEDKTGKLAKTNAIASTTRGAFWTLAFLLFVIAFYYYLSQVLHSFPGTRGIAAILLEYFTGPILSIAWAFAAEIPDLFMITVIFLVVRYLLKIIRLIFENIELGMIRIERFEPSWTWPTFWISKVILILFALILAYPYIPGSETDAFKGITILLGVILSFGSTSVVSNLLSGLFVIYRRGINVGDWIEIKEQTGVVESITLLETQLRSSKNELISIPNTQLLGSELTNYTRQGETQGILLHTSVGIGYEEPQRKIEKMLLEAARRTDGFKTKPEPFVLKQALADHAVVYEVNAYAESVTALPKLKSALHSNILDVFNENLVQIMTPSYEADPATPKIAPADDIE
jgi:small-conductance mechanosensitive channel